jgi:hypothetical protein
MMDQLVDPERGTTVNQLNKASPPEVMLRCMVEDLAWMGYEEEQLITFFRDAFFPALHCFWIQFGEEELRQRLQQILGQTEVSHPQQCHPEDSVRRCEHEQGHPEPG